MKMCFPRFLNERELKLFTWCAAILPEPDRTAFVCQLAACQIVDVDDGGIWFRLSDEAPRVSIQGIDLTYNDSDGEHVEFIIAFVAGYLNWIDFYRNDEVKMQIAIPSPGDVLSHQIIY